MHHPEQKNQQNTGIHSHNRGQVDDNAIKKSGGFFKLKNVTHAFF